MSKLLMKTAPNTKDFMKFGQQGRTLITRLKEIADKRVILEQVLADRSTNENEQKWDIAIRVNFGLVAINYFHSEKKYKTEFIDSDDSRRVRSRIHFRMGVMLDDLFDQPQLAEIEYKNAVDLDSTYSSSRYRLWLLVNEKDRSRATQVIDKIFDLSAKIKEEYVAARYGQLGGVFYNIYHDFLGSKIAFERQVNADSKNATAHYNLGVILR